MTIKIFDRREGERDGEYRLCDGKSHFEVKYLCGALGRVPYSDTCQKQEPCDGSCSQADEIPAEDLPEAVKKALGLLTTVPKGLVFVEQLNYGFRVLGEGDDITLRQLASGRLLKPGESMEVIEIHNNTKGARWATRSVVYNDDGKPVVKDGDKEARKNFAREQMNYLIGLGFCKAKAASIMKAAGPGQVRAAMEWLYQSLEILKGRYERHTYWGEPEEVSEEERLAAAIDALDVIFKGQGGSNNFGFGRMASVLRALGLPDPRCSTARTFWGVLNGAHMAIICGLPKKKPEQVEQMK